MYIEPNVCVYVLQMSDGKQIEQEQPAIDEAQRKLSVALDQIQQAAKSGTGVGEILVQGAQRAHEDAARQAKELLLAYNRLRAKPSELARSLKMAADAFHEAQTLVANGGGTEGPMVAMIAQQTIMVAALMEQRNKQDPSYLAAVQSAVAESRNSLKLAETVAKQLTGVHAYLGHIATFMDGVNTHLGRIAAFVSMDAVEMPKESDILSFSDATVSGDMDAVKRPKESEILDLSGDGNMEDDMQEVQGMDPRPRSCGSVDTSSYIEDMTEGRSERGKRKAEHADAGSNNKKKKNKPTKSEEFVFNRINPKHMEMTAEYLRGLQVLTDLTARNKKCSLGTCDKIVPFNTKKRGVDQIQRSRFCFFCFGIFCDSKCRTAHSMEKCRQHLWLRHAYENKIYGKEANYHPTKKADDVQQGNAEGRNEMEAVFTRMLASS